MDDRSRALFSHTNCLSKVHFHILYINVFNNIYLFILQVANLLLTINQYNLIVAALCTNLTLNEKNSQLLIANRGLKPFVQLAIDTTDLMYFKILHNMSSHESLKPQFVVCIIVLIIIECIVILYHKKKSNR